MSYDSTQDTLMHINSVQNKINVFRDIMSIRAGVHDQSKLQSPEKELFDEMTPILKSLTYGSDEYKDSLGKLKPALDHHYANNSHHPEHYADGIKGMDLADLVEMFCDWLAATERTANGDIYKSIGINQNRFNIPPELSMIFYNTAKRIYGIQPVS